MELPCKDSRVAEEVAAQLVGYERVGTGVDRWARFGLMDVERGSVAFVGEVCGGADVAGARKRCGRVQSRAHVAVGGRERTSVFVEAGDRRPFEVAGDDRVDKFQMRLRFAFDSPGDRRRVGGDG